MERTVKSPNVPLWRTQQGVPNYCGDHHGEVGLTGSQTPWPRREGAAITRGHGCVRAGPRPAVPDGQHRADLWAQFFIWLFLSDYKNKLFPL
jgi:hypothetical protein